MNPDNNLQLSYFIQNEIKQTLPWGKPETPYPPVNYLINKGKAFISILFNLVFL